MDPILARSPAMFRAFALYLRWYFARNFNAVRVSLAGLPQLPPGRPVVIVTNHPSWWDPAMFILLTDTLMRDRAGFGPMDEAALVRYGFMCRLGIFGVELGTTRGAGQFLRIGQRILRDPTAALWITGEGHFTDPRTRPIALRPGLAHLARRAPDAAMVPMAVEYPFWNERKPEALVRFGPTIETDRDRDVTAWTATVAASLETQMEALAAESRTRDPALFRTIVAGGSGVGGVYDTWRRARAWSRGRRARLSHGPEPE